MNFSRRSNPSTTDEHDDPPFAVIHDLTLTDTTGWEGFEDLERSALQLLVQDSAIRYLPESKGSLETRSSLAEFQQPANPEQWILTASSSEAYSLLFQLLCDPGSTIATPRPGYPLVDELARFHDVKVVGIPLRLVDSTWHLDLGWLERRFKEGVKILTLVQPSNPTGWVLSEKERRRVLELCRTYSVALISDEVFDAWVTEPFDSLANQNEVLCFTLGGLSKLLGLPHLKLGWIRVSGPGKEVEEALVRLELLNDALLSASTPVQRALPLLLKNRPSFQAKIQARLDGNRTAWTRFGKCLPETFQTLDSRNGWFGILQWKGPIVEAKVCTELAFRYGIKVLPGYLFDLPRAGFVVSFLSPPSAYLHALPLVVELLISLEP